MAQTALTIQDFPIGEEFITGEKLFTINHPQEAYYSEDQNGNRQLEFGKNARARLMSALWKIPATELSDELLDQLYGAIQDIGYFVRDFRVWYEPGDHKLLPRIEYKTFKPEQVPFIPNPEAPAFIHYKNQLLVLRQLRLAERPIPEELLGYLNQAESDLFLGPENDRIRAKIMEDAIRKYFPSCVVQWAILSILYTSEEFSRIYEEHIKKAEISTKEKKQPKPLPSAPYRISGHLIDQKLKYDYPFDRQNGAQLMLFETLTSRTQAKINEAGVSVETIVEGIPLTPSQDKLILALSKILFEKSQTDNPSGKDYFAGSLPVRAESLVEYGESKEIAPRLVVTLHELAREYNGDITPSGGKILTNVKALLEELTKKQYLISYVQTTALPGGKKRQQKIEEFMPLVRTSKYTDVKTNSQGLEDSRKEEILITLNPIFRHKIDSKFIEVPGDLNRRTMIAYGSHNVSDAAIRLRDYLLRELSSKRSKCELGVDRLHYLLCEKWMREGRRKKVAEYVAIAIETNTNLGLITKYETVPSKTVEGKKVIFHLNKKFPEAAE